MTLLVELILGIGIFLILCFSAISILIWKFSQPTKINKDYTYLPKVSIIIPTMNEEAIIKRRIQNIVELDYPHNKLEVLFVDNSKDNTAKIISEYTKDYPFLKIIYQKEKGFNNALNQGYSAASGEIVIKSDCTAFPQSNALREITSNFADRTVGAVTGVHKFTNSADDIEKNFKGIMYKVQLMESFLHSSLLSHGSFGAYRKTLIPTLGQEITADDSDVVINVVRNGYRAIVDTQVISEEESPISFKDRRSQKNRRAAGVIRVILKNLDMLFNRKYGWFGIVTMPVEFFILVLSSVSILLLILFSLIFLLSFSFPFGLFIPASILLLTYCSSKISTKFRVIVDTYISLFFCSFSSIH